MIQDISTPFFFPTCHVFKKLFELSRVELYTNVLKGNKNYFELEGGLIIEGSSYQG